MWRRPEPVLDRETVAGIIRKLMDIDVKLELIVEPFGLSDDDEAEEGEDDS